MEKGPGVSPSHGFSRALIRWWLALTRRKIRMLQSQDMAAEGPALFAVSHPAGFLEGLVLTTAIERPVHCLLAKSLARGPLARSVARHLGIILYEGERPTSEATIREALDILASGGALVVFADPSTAGQGAAGALASYRRSWFCGQKRSAWGAGLP